MTETHSIYSRPATHVIIPRAIEPDTPSSHYVIPPHVHVKILPCVLLPTH